MSSAVDASEEGTTPSEDAPNITVMSLDAVRWEDVSTKGVFGHAFDHFSSKQLRTICSRLNVKGVKNVKKQDMIDRLVHQSSNWKKYENLKNRNKPRKQAGCSFCLMNILFSDAFAEQFATIGATATRQVLNAGKASCEEPFWESVQKVFVTCDEEGKYDRLLFDDDEHFVNTVVDPSQIVHHDWKKLRQIWKGVNAEYKAALTRFTLLGTHENEFYNFCNGRLDIFYLRKHLGVRPQLNAFVEADLPPECGLSSDRPYTPSDSTTTPSSSDNGCSSATIGRKRKKIDPKLAVAIEEFGNSGLRTEVAKHKLQFMGREDVRRDKENVRREEEHKLRKVEHNQQVELRQAEHDRRQAEHNQQLHMTVIAEWEKVQSNIVTLRKYRDASTDDHARREFDLDIDGLLKRKNELAAMLRFK